MRVTSLLFLVSLGAVFTAGSAVVAGCTSLPDLVEAGDASLGNEITLADGGHAIVESDGAVVPTGDDTNPGSDGSTGTMTGEDGSTGTMTGDDDSGTTTIPDGGSPADAAPPPDGAMPPVDAGPPVCVKTKCGTGTNCSGCTSCNTEVHGCLTCSQISCGGFGAFCCASDAGAYCSSIKFGESAQTCN